MHIHCKAAQTTVICKETFHQLSTLIARLHRPLSSVRRPFTNCLHLLQGCVDQCCLGADLSPTVYTKCKALHTPLSSGKKHFPNSLHCHLETFHQLSTLTARLHIPLSSGRRPVTNSLHLLQGCTDHCHLGANLPTSTYTYCKAV